jgi:hypothetical protein
MKRFKAHTRWKLRNSEKSEGDKKEKKEEMKGYETELQKLSKKELG